MATNNTRLWAIAALVVMGTSFTACLKSIDTTPSRPLATFAVINGIVSSTAVDFYDNNTKIQTGLALGFGGFGYQAYGGSHKFDFMKAGTTTPFTTITNTFDSLQYYTMITYGDSTSAVSRPLKDDFSNLSSSVVNMRFFNLSPNSPAVDLYIGDIKVDSNVVYAGSGSFNTTFRQLTSISTSGTLKVKLAGSTASSPSIVENSTISLSSGNVYTFFLAGRKDSVGPLKPVLNYVRYQ
jgi:hypothetical protein